VAEAGAGRYRNRSTPLELVSERGEGYLETRKKSTSDCVCVTCAADGMGTVWGGGVIRPSSLRERVSGRASWRR